MNTARFLRALRQRGIELRADGDRIVVNAPKGAVTEADGDEIRRRKADLLAFLRMGAEGGGGVAAFQRIPSAEHPVAADGTIEAPASFGQRRLFYLDQLEPGLAVYNVPVAFYLRGRVDAVALRTALSQIVQRHAVLRTTLALAPSGVVQRVAKEADVELEIVDVPSSARDAVGDLLKERACRPFDLTKGPLFRPTLLRVSAEENVLLVASHHVVTDGWSQDVFESELCELYEAAVSGRPSTLAPPPIQYADYAAWQTATRTDTQRDERLAYWKENLRGPLPILELPTTHARPNVAPTEGATASITLPADLLEPLGALARRDGATLFMTLVAAYATLLHRISGQEDVVIGTPIANRTHAETLELIGYFANTIALRVDLSGRPTFRELLRRVRETCTAAYAHAEAPFEELVEVLDVQRDLSRSPIFQTIFAFEDAMPSAPARGGDAASQSLSIVRRDTVHAGVARTDLSAWVSASADGLCVTFEYPTALFDAPAVARLLDHLQVLLRALADGADGPIDELPILSTETRRRILVEWNATERALPAVRGAHELFEQRVDADGERVAVVMGDLALSYAALDVRANQLAHHLVSLGVGRGALVGVFLERSPEMVVALLATLKTGAAYVPIDPEYPADRIAHMIEDAALERVVTSEGLLGRLPAEVGTVVVDREASAIAARPSSRLAPAERGDSPSEDPAYVLYTSGSTGRPKGVVIPHRALVNFLASMAQRPGLTAEDTLLAVTTLSFDIAGLEMYLPLTVGAKMVIASAEQAADGRDLRDLVDSSGASFMQATPSTWRLLVGAGWKGRGGAPFKVLCGGEAFPPELAAQLLERATSVWNMYGPTETTIWSTCVELTKDDPRITIGRPIDNTTVYVLDGRGEPTPVGVPGELHIGGAGVAHGYLRRPELTESRFIDDPFAPGTGRRLYRTGDLASFRDDGQLVYHRRLDHQVKVRGYRIELGEIESVLVDHEALAQAVVVVREDRPGDARLVAYYVVTKGTDVTATDLRKHLRRRLPDYMIPQHFVELPSLPLTPAGKIDRKRLPSPAAPAAEAARAPTTEAEKRLAAIWADVLGTTRIGATDNFFDLGGHSMLSMAVVARVQSEMGARISPRDLLLSTLEHLASQIAPATPPRPAEAPRAEVAPPSSTREPPPPQSLTQSLVSRLKGKLFG